MIGLAAWGMAGAAGQAAAVPEKEALPEMWTTLQGRLESGRLKAGDTVAVQLMDGWVYRTCGVDGGAVVKGVVTSAQDQPPARGTELSLRFTADCIDGTKIPLILMAVYFPLEDDKSAMDVFKAMPTGIGPGATGRSSTDLSRMPSSAQEHPVLPLARMGEVQRIPHLTLGVASGAQAATALRSTAKKLRLEKGTRLVFVPVPGSR